MGVALIAIVNGSPSGIVVFSCFTVVKLPDNPTVIDHLFIRPDIPSFPRAFEQELMRVLLEDAGVLAVFDLLLVIVFARDVLVLPAIVDFWGISLRVAEEAARTLTHCASTSL